LNYASFGIQPSLLTYETPSSINSRLDLSKYLEKYVPNFRFFFPAINSPTVPVGEETLRLAPTPHHTKEMMDQFAHDLLKVWIDLGLELKPRNAERRQCPQSGEFCVFCEKPMIFEQMEARTRECPVPNCPQITATA
jgi:5-aminolevulinate synthase